MNLLEASKALEESLSILNHWSSYVDNNFKQKWDYDKDVALIQMWIQDCKEAHAVEVKNKEEMERRIAILHDMLEDKWW